MSDKPYYKLREFLDTFPLGCGLCAGICPTEAIWLHLREDRQEPFDRAFDLYQAILEKKPKEEKTEL